MLKKEITYTNFDDEEVTEIHYFNVTHAELIEMDIEQGGGMKEVLEKISKEQNPVEIMKAFKGFIGKAYGTRLPDGKFIKSPEISNAFFASEAYSTLLIELMTDADKAAEFMNGLTPKGVEETAAKIAAATGGAPLVAVPTQEPIKLTKADIIAMDDSEFRSGIATGKYVISDEF